MKSLHRRFTQRSFHTQKLLHKEVFTQSGFYIQKVLHTKAFTQRSLCTEAHLHEVISWNWQQFLGKNPCHELFSKNIRNIFLKQVPIQSFQAHGADEGRPPLKYPLKLAQVFFLFGGGGGRFSNRGKELKMFHPWMIHPRFCGFEVFQDSWPF